MAISFVQKSSLVETNDGGSTVNSVQLTGVTAGNCLVVVGSVFLGSTTLALTGVSDGTAYTVRSSKVDDGSSYKQIQFVAYLPNAGAGTHTATVSVSGTGLNLYAVIGMAEFSGVATTTPEDVWDGNDDQSITTNDLNAGPITTTEAGDLLIGSAGFSPDSTTSIAWASPTSWTNLFRQNDGYTSGTGHDSGFWLPGSIQTSYTPTWAHRNISGYEGSAVVVALKAAAAAATPSLLLPQSTLQRVPALRRF